MTMNYPDKVYVTILSTNTYLPGVLTLHHSLMQTNTKYKFYCLITPNLSKEVKEILYIFDIETITITPLSNPHNTDINDRRFYNYSKLNMFGLTQFKKIVYLDADMIVMHNIDELFEKKNMSGTNAGGWLDSNKGWVQLNSGLIVVEPNANVFADMKSKIGLIEKDKGKGDQAFLHSYYSNWPDQDDLHLDHVYNVFHTHLDGYKKKHGYYLDKKIKIDNTDFDKSRIKIVHYIGQEKPWNNISKILNHKNKNSGTLKMKAEILWLKYYTNALEHKNMDNKNILQ